MEDIKLHRVEQWHERYVDGFRDADKPDIFGVVDDILSNKRYGDFPELLLNVRLA
ncbi:MAG: hypothetical protein HZA50_17065 [Planctomycetes bacterium]|nr:hypothetical protein [Planctomycetota bacterium]